MLQTLLNKVLADGTMAELANQVSGVVLLLLAALRQTYDNGSAGDSKGASSTKKDNYVSILDSTARAAAGSTSGGDGRQKSMVYSTALHVILKGLIMWTSNTSKHK